MKRVGKVLVVAAFVAMLMVVNVSPAFAAKPEPDKNYGWGPCTTNGCGHKEGVAWGGHTPGTPNGFCSETFEYAYECNKVTKY